MKNRNLKIKLNILYFIVFGSLACYTSFLTPYFLDRGLSYSQIGILLAVYSLISVLAPPFWGAVTDKYADKKKTMIITMAASGVIVLGFIISKSFYSILVVIIAFMFFQSPIISINDANTYDLIDIHKDIKYGRIRLMGSVGYALTAFILGFIIKNTNVNVPYLIFFIFIIVGLILLGTIKEKGKRTVGHINMNDIVGIIKNKRFILISISALLVCAAYNSNGNYISVLVKATGGDVANLGMLWFIVAMSELPFFVFESKIINKYGALNIFMTAVAFYIIRYFINSLCTSYQMVLAIQLLQAFTFPLYLTSTLKYVIKIVPPETRTTALTVFSAITTGIGGFIGNMGGGFLLQIISIFQLYRIFVLLCIIALLTGLILKRVDKKSSLI